MPRTLRDPDTAACLTILQQGSKSFALAGRLLPRRLRPPVAAVYAFCREADDAVDEAVGRDETQLALARLRRRLDGIYRGTQRFTAVDRALSKTVTAFNLPYEIFAALLEGFAWDAQMRQYETVADLHAYAARVAGTVGALMTLIMGNRDANVLARACDLAVAMQLTNIARDVGQDARAGRLYLPHQWLREADIEPHAFLREPRFTGGLGDVVRRVLNTARTLYARAEAGIGVLPADCRVAIYAARLIYQAIGRKIAANAYNSVDTRAVVATPRKVWLLIYSLTARFCRWPPNTAACLPETRFLLHAALTTEGAGERHGQHVS